MMLAWNCTAALGNFMLLPDRTPEPSPDLSQEPLVKSEILPSI